MKRQNVLWWGSFLSRPIGSSMCCLYLDVPFSTLGKFYGMILWNSPNLFFPHFEELIWHIHLDTWLYSINPEKCFRFSGFLWTKISWRVCLPAQPVLLPRQGCCSGFLLCFLFGTLAFLFILCHFFSSKAQCLCKVSHP